MSSAPVTDRIPVRYGIVLLAALLVSFVYALLVANLLRWAWAVGAAVSLSLALFLCYLLYRAVLAIERISYKL